MVKPKIGFVVQRYGEDVAGGAETLCRLIAEKMIPYWNIDVITSCARDYVNRFGNEFPPGVEIIDDVTVRRFEIDYLRSNDDFFSRLDRKVLRRGATREEETLWLKEIGPYSSALISYIKKFQDQYDLFFFFTYLYATTTLILPIVCEKSFLVPAAHDEPPIHARFFDDFFALPKGLIFSTEEEMVFLRKRTSDRMATSFVIGVGVDQPKHLSPDSFRQKYQLDGKFVLYVGRIQTQKGCDELFNFYLSLPKEIKGKYPLVLIGKSAMDIPESEYIMPVGFVSDEMKYNAMAAAELVIMPSRFESLNMVILESWLCGTPVLVNGHCDVLRGHCRRSNGGLWYDNYVELEACLDLMLGNKGMLEQMGIRGKDYVEKNYDWPKIESNYRELVQDPLRSNRSGPSIFQTGLREITRHFKTPLIKPEVLESKKRWSERTVEQGESEFLDFLVSPCPLPKGETEESIFEYLSGFHFDEEAPTEELDNYLRQDFRRFLYTLSIIPEGSGRLLEIGANPYFTSMLIKRYTNYELYCSNFFGLGVVEKSLQYKVNQEGERIDFEFWHFNVEEDEIPFDHGYFDVILFCEVIEHLIKDPLKALLNIKGLLKKDGYLIFSTPNVARLENVVKMISGNNIYDPYSGHGLYGRHNREYNKDELSRLFAHAGFDIEVMFSSDVHENRSNSFCSLNEVIDLLQYRKLDLGQYIFGRARNRSKANNKLKPAWLYRSYPSDRIE